MRARKADKGAILVLTLVLTVVLAVVVAGVASYIIVGLRTSGVTDDRNETNADGAAAVTWAMEEFRQGSLDTAVNCDAEPGIEITVPPDIEVNGSSTTLFCETTSSNSTFPIVYLRASATNSNTTREVQAVVQVASGTAVRALDWKVDNADLVGP